MNKHAIIINFEGVLGDWYKRNMIDNSFPSLYFRPNVFSALRRLQR